MQKYHHLLLIVKKNHPPAQSFAHMLQNWLAQQNYTSQICDAIGLTLYGLEKKPDLAVVLGGDGTMLGVGRLFAGQDIPIVGINFGRIGFLTLASQTDWEPKLRACLRGELPLQPRLTLTWSLTRKNVTIESGTAVNDVVIGHGALARLVQVHISSDEESMGSLRCDGIILSSPMGSSGYTASAGGPILFTQSNNYVFTPICPFRCAIASMVFPANIVFKAVIDGISTDTHLTIDGQEGYPMEHGDILTVTGQPNSLFFVGTDTNFFESIRRRGLILEASLTDKCS